MLRPGAVVGRFELVRELGRGGFGVVWEARDRQLGRGVAFKAVRAGGTPALREERLLQEAEAAARLSHPNIVTLHDVGRAEPGAYLGLRAAARRAFPVEGAWAQRPGAAAPIAIAGLEGLGPLLVRMLERGPTARPRDAAVVLAELEAIAEELSRLDRGRPRTGGRHIRPVLRTSRSREDVMTSNAVTKKLVRIAWGTLLAAAVLAPTLANAWWPGWRWLFMR